MKNFLALVLFAGAFAAWYLHHQKQETTTALNEAKVELEAREKNDAVRLREFNALKEALELRRQVEILRENVTAILAKQKVLDQSRNALASERQNVLIAIRKTFTGREFPDLRLKSGKVLGKAKIIKVDSTGVSVAVASGILKVPPQDLPDDLRKQFFY